MTPNMQATLAALRALNLMCDPNNCDRCKGQRLMRKFDIDQATAISQAFNAGNYCNAYETQCLEDCELDEYSEHERAAFVLGFFGSYSLDEIGSDRDAFDEAYWSDAGQYVVNVARYCDSRTDEYTAESEAF
jgi:hypothetical protein